MKRNGPETSDYLKLSCLIYLVCGRLSQEDLKYLMEVRMKKFIILFFVMACGSRDYSWDSGAQKQQTYREEQRQEQIENTNMQDTTPGRSGVGQNQPF